MSLQKITPERRLILYKLNTSFLDTITTSSSSDVISIGIDDIFGGQPMDSNLKRNSSFMKRLRTINADNFSSLAKDFAGLSLQKFLSESTEALLSIRLRNHSDIAAVVEMSSLFHQRYKLTFTKELLFRLQQQLKTLLSNTELDPLSGIALGPTPNNNSSGTTTKQDENKNSTLLSRRKMTVKLFVELRFCGVFSFFSEIDSGILKMFKMIFAIPSISSSSPFSNNAPFMHLPLLNNVLKFYSYLLLPSGSSDSSSDQVFIFENQENNFFFQEHEPLLSALEEYHRSLTRAFVARHSRCMMACKSSRRAYERGVDLDTDYKRGGYSLLEDIATVDLINKELAQLSTTTAAAPSKKQTISLPLFEGLSFAPSMSQDESGSGGGIVFLSKIDSNDLSFIDGTSAFECEDERRFYEDLIKLEDVVPKILLPDFGVDGSFDDNSGTGSGVSGHDTKIIDDNQEVPDLLDHPSVDPSNEGGNPEEEEEASLETLATLATTTASTSTSSSTDSRLQGKKIEDFLASLRSLSSQAEADKAAIAFCHLNKGKNWRKGFVGLLFTTTKRRIDLLPFIGRFLATIVPYFADVANEVREAIVGQWLFLGRNPSINVIGTRNRIARFAGELVKFCILSQGIAFSMMKMIAHSSEDSSLLTPPNVEMLSMYLESCGRFMSRQGESLARMIWLDSLLRKKIRSGLLGSTDLGLIVILENSLLSSMPPSAEEIERRRSGGRWKERRRKPSVKEQFILHLLGASGDASASTGGQNQVNTESIVVGKLRKFDHLSAADATLLREILSNTPIKFGESKYCEIVNILKSLRAWNHRLVEGVIDCVIEEGFVSLILLPYEHLLKKKSLHIKASLQFIKELFLGGLLCSSTIYLIAEEVLRAWRDSTISIVVNESTGRIDSFSIFHCFILLDILLILPCAYGGSAGVDGTSYIVDNNNKDNTAIRSNNYKKENNKDETKTLIASILKRYNTLFMERVASYLVNKSASSASVSSMIVDLMEEELRVGVGFGGVGVGVEGQKLVALESLIPKEYVHKLEEVLERHCCVDLIPHRSADIRNEIILMVKKIRDGSFAGNDDGNHDDYDVGDGENLSTAKAANDDFEVAFQSFLKDNQSTNNLVERRHVSSRTFEARIPDSNKGHNSINGVLKDSNMNNSSNDSSQEKKNLRLMIKKNQSPLLRELHVLPGDYQRSVIEENVRKAKERETVERSRIKASVLRDLDRQG